jgi:NAD-dependent deacetylase
MYLELHTFLGNPQESWPVIKEIFYTKFIHSEPNGAHVGLAILEKKGLLENIITQNIDNLHQESGNTKVFEFHGNSKYFVCTGCKARYKAADVKITNSPPRCKDCSGLLKPDFIFFGEGIPEGPYFASIEAIQNADVLIIIGTSGQVAPANQIPYLAKQNGAKIIEINLEPSVYTRHISDFFLQGKASVMMEKLLRFL